MRSPSQSTAKTLKRVQALGSNNPRARKCASDRGVPYAKGTHLSVFYNVNVHVTELLSEL